MHGWAVSAWLLCRKGRAVAAPATCARPPCTGSQPGQLQRSVKGSQRSVPQCAVRALVRSRRDDGKSVHDKLQAALHHHARQQRVRPASVPREAGAQVHAAGQARRGAAHPRRRHGARGAPAPAVQSIGTAARLAAATSPRCPVPHARTSRPSPGQRKVAGDAQRPAGDGQASAAAEPGAPHAVYIP